MFRLGFNQGKLLRSSFARPNLQYVVRKDGNKYEQLMRIVRNVEGSGIVYMSTRDECEKLAARAEKDIEFAQYR
jgi:ATP-dependent DNA helicase RecQ